MFEDNCRMKQEIICLHIQKNAFTLKFIYRYTTGNKLYLSSQLLHTKNFTFSNQTELLY